MTDSPTLATAPEKALAPKKPRRPYSEILREVYGEIEPFNDPDLTSGGFVNHAKVREMRRTLRGVVASGVPALRRGL